MSNNTTTPKGVVNPTTQGMLAGNPQDSAAQQSSNTAAKAAKLNAAVGGRKKRRNTKKKYGGDISAPQYSNMQYTPTNGPSEHPNSQIASNTQTSTQTVENNKYDQLAKSGGSKKKKRSTKRVSRSRRVRKQNKTKKTKIKLNKNKNGGKMSNPDWNWGRYS
jgi:hypothetical protein